MNNEIELGVLAEFIIYVNMLSWPVASVGWITSLIQRSAASQERINEFLNTKSEIINYTNEQTPIQGDIEFKNVSFTYPDTGIMALKNVSFKAKEGSTLAIFEFMRVPCPAPNIMAVFILVWLRLYLEILGTKK